MLPCVPEWAALAFPVLGVEELQSAGTAAQGQPLQGQPAQPPAAEPEELWDPVGLKANVTALVCDTQNAGRAAPAWVTGSAGLGTPVFLSAESAALRAAAGASAEISSCHRMELLNSAQPLHWLYKYFPTGIFGFVTNCTAVLL